MYRELFPGAMVRERERGRDGMRVQKWEKGPTIS